MAHNLTAPFVGFGTAALGNNCFQVVQMALEAGFRTFDTAEEHDWWYRPEAVGDALQEYYQNLLAVTDDECVMTMEDEVCPGSENHLSALSFCQELRVSTKIPPWELTSEEHIRSNAQQSRQQLVGFCDMTLDIYYIHAPACWKGWHTRCENPPPTLDLRQAWLAMEAVVGIDGSAQRIGLSNVHPNELLDIIQFVHERRDRPNSSGAAPPRMPDVLQAFADPLQPADELRRICREHGIEFVSYSTLGTQHRSHGNKNPVLGSPIVQALAAKHQRSIAEVVLSWAIQKGMSVIPRSSQLAHIQELARLLPSSNSSPAQGFLNAEDVAQIDSLPTVS